MKPESLEQLINSFKNLPGISRKQAERIAYFLVDNKIEEQKELVISIEKAMKELRKCKQCGHMTDQEMCNICTDKDRLKTLIILESSLDVFKFEDGQDIHPYYHVLGGLINVSNNKTFDELNIQTLLERAKKYKEIIIALSPNLEGIVTANYLKELLKGNKVTQLAQGIPLGAAMEYVDKLTLKAAIENRKEVK